MSGSCSTVLCMAINRLITWLLRIWVNVYDGDLGIALSDTYTSEVFMKNLSRKQAKLFDGGKM